LCVADAARAKSRSFGGSSDKAHGQSGNATGFAIVVILQGDSWEWGSGSTVDGSALASIGQVMVVTLNYRLGVLGKFLYGISISLNLKTFWSS
jgi:carboxylesterase type B